jgi:hypothetical protein
MYNLTVKKQIALQSGRVDALHNWRYKQKEACRGGSQAWAICRKYEPCPQPKDDRRQPSSLIDPRLVQGLSIEHIKAIHRRSTEYSTAEADCLCTVVLGFVLLLRLTLIEFEASGISNHSLLPQSARWRFSSQSAPTSTVSHCRMTTYHIVQAFGVDHIPPHGNTAGTHAPQSTFRLTWWAAQWHCSSRQTVPHSSEPYESMFNNNISLKAGSM